MTPSLIALGLRTVALGGTGVLVLAGTSPVALASHGVNWAAELESQSPHLTLEAGQTASSFFRARNVGDQGWRPSFVRLGTDRPHDRASVFAHPDWISLGRPTPVEEEYVSPGDVGTFAFSLLAPSVTTTTVYDEYFAPLAERIAWMDQAFSPRPWADNVFLRYTVRPAQSPRVRITSMTSEAVQGTPARVSAEATDNVGIARVSFSVDGRAPVHDDSAPYEVLLPTDDLAPGSHTVIARALDHVGQDATDVAGFTVRRASRGPGNEVGITINGGAAFTHSREVVLGLNAPASATEVLIANDGGFESAERRPVAIAQEWVLDASAAQRLPRIVYVRFLGSQDVDPTQTFTDDIILDETRPQIIDIAPVRLRDGERGLIVRARDGISGVDALEMVRGARRVGPVPFRGRGKVRVPRSLRRGKARISVRVRDRAGNYSRVRRVSLRLRRR